MAAHQHNAYFSPFSHFAAVSQCGVAGPAQTFPSLTVNGSFLPDPPRFHVLPEHILPPQLRSSSRALPSIFISTTALMFSVSSLHLTWPNHSNLLLLITVAICSIFASSKMSSYLRCSNRLSPSAHRTILISAVAIRLSSLTDIGHVSPPYSSVGRVTVCMVYQDLQFRWDFLVANHSTQFSPFRPCLCFSVLHVFAGSSSPVYRCSNIFAALDCWQVDTFCIRVALHSNRICLLCCL